MILLIVIIKRRYNIIYYIKGVNSKARKLKTPNLKSSFSYSISSPIYLISNLLCYSHDIINFPSLSYTFSFSIPFLSFHSFILSFYRVLYNLYLNPNLLKILLNYTFTIPKVTTLHTYILTSCPIFLYTFSLFLLFLHFYFLTHFLPFLTPFSILLYTFLSPFFFLHAFLSYFLTFPTHCLTVPKLILLYLVISYYPFNCKHYIMPSYCAVLYLVIINFIGSSFRSLCNSALLCHYCAIVDHLLICLLL